VSKALHFKHEMPVTVRFSANSGISKIADTDPRADPRGLAIRFRLPDGSDTDLERTPLQGGTAWLWLDGVWIVKAGSEFGRCRGGPHSDDDTSLREVSPAPPGVSTTSPGPRTPQRRTAWRRHHRAPWFAPVSLPVMRRRSSWPMSKITASLDCLACYAYLNVG
jgi:hypothetical protein